MLSVTENAKRHLKSLLVENTSDHNLGIRLRIGKGMQLGVMLDHRADDDYVVEHEGDELLLVGPELFPLVNDTILDTQKDGSIESLVIAKRENQPGRRIQGDLFERDRA